MFSLAGRMYRPDLSFIFPSRISRIMRYAYGFGGSRLSALCIAVTELGLKHAVVNQPLEVATLRPELANLVSFPGRRPDLIMRIGYGPMFPFSARRPVAKVLVYRDRLSLCSCAFQPAWCGVKI